MVGVRRETVLFIEKGEYNPSLNLAHAIAKALKTSSTSSSFSMIDRVRAGTLTFGHLSRSALYNVRTEPLHVM